MLKVALYNQQGEKKGDVTLNEELFGLPANPSLIQRMVQYQMNNAQISFAASENKTDCAYPNHE